MLVGIWIFRFNRVNHASLPLLFMLRVRVRVRGVYGVVRLRLDVGCVVVVVGL